VNFQFPSQGKAPSFFHDASAAVKNRGFSQ
jgi:hypothetical protein